MTDDERVARLALIDRILAALVGRPAPANVICARIGTVNCWCEGCRGVRRRAHPPDLYDALDALSLSGAIKGEVVVIEDGRFNPRTVVVWHRMLPADTLVLL